MKFIVNVDQTEDIVENVGSLQTELEVNLECDVDTEVQVQTECVLQNESQIGAESVVPTQRHVETECGVDTEERDKPEYVHANTDESDSVDLLASDESGSDAHDEELAATRKLLREEAKMQKQRRSNKPFQESNNEKPTQPETKGIYLEEPASNDNEANDSTAATKNVGQNVNATEEVGPEPKFVNSDDELSYEEESGEEGHGNIRRQKSKRVFYNPTGTVPTFLIGMVFKSAEEFRTAIAKYAIARGVEIKF